MNFLRRPLIASRPLALVWAAAQGLTELIALWRSRWSTGASHPARRSH